MSYVWNTDVEEFFNFLTWQWNVQEAKRLLAAKKRPPKIGALPVAAALRLVGRSTPTMMTLGVSVNWDLATHDPEGKINLEVPVLMIPFDGTNLPIDGYHRIARASVLGLETLPAIMLSAADAKRIQVR